MIKLLDNIQKAFLDIDSALKVFNQDIATNLTQANIVSKLPSLNTLISEKLNEVKVNMAAFEIALKTQKIEELDVDSRTKIQQAKIVLESTHSRLAENIEQLEGVRKSSPTFGVALVDLLKNMEDWKFLLAKHLEQYEMVLR